MTLEGFLALFERRTKAGAGYNVRCPAHEDRQASLSVTQAENKILLHCHAGCDIHSILKTINLTMRDLFTEEEKEHIIAEYNYTDETNQLLYQVCRWQPKKFTQRRPLPGGKWANNLENVERVPYRLQEIINSKDIILIVEGEKDVEFARSLKFIATCNSGGAGKWREEWSKYFDKRIVYILPDNDEPGRKHAQYVASLLTGATVFVASIEHHKDLSDWAPTREQLAELLRNAPQWTVDQQYKPLGIKDMPGDVLCGRLGEILQNRMGRFPIAYAWPALVAIAGTLVRRSTSTLRQNLFCALVGPPHSGKSQAIEQAGKVLGLEPPYLQNVMAGSAEGLLHRLKDANGRARLVSMDELGHMLSKAHIENASFPYILNRAFYNTRFDLTIAKQKAVEFNCEMGLLGGCVTGQFDSLFDATTVHGLYDRFIFGLHPEPYTYEYRPYEGNAEAFNDAPPITVDRDVWAVKDAWVKEGMSPRCAENALRVAGICCAYDGYEELKPKYLGPAKALGDYLTRLRLILRPNPGENPDAKCAYAILGALGSSTNGDWIGKRDLGRSIHAYRLGPSVFRRALDNLCFNAEVERKAEGAQKAEFYRLKHEG